MRSKVLRLFSILTLCGLATTNLSAGQKKKGKLHLPLHHALWETKHARFELKESKIDFGNLRPRADLAMANAIAQIEICLVKVGDAPTATPGKRDLKEEYRKYAHHPHLHHTLVELKHAHKHLKSAKHDFGGNRQAAMRDIEQAIQEVSVLLKFIKKVG